MTSENMEHLLQCHSFSIAILNFLQMYLDQRIWWVACKTSNQNKQIVFFWVMSQTEGQGGQIYVDMVATCGHVDMVNTYY